MFWILTTLPNTHISCGAGAGCSCVIQASSTLCPRAVATHRRSSTVGPGGLIVGDSSHLRWSVSGCFGVSSLWQEQDANRSCSSSLTCLRGKDPVLLLLRGGLRGGVHIYSLLSRARMLLLLKSVVQFLRHTERPDRRGISQHITAVCWFCT